jgi:hypothetical protein
MGHFNGNIFDIAKKQKKSFCHRVAVAFDQHRR